MLLSPAASIDGLGVAVTSMTVFPAEAPSVQGAMLLLTGKNGASEALIDSALVTRWITAADSLLGAQLLARRDSGRLLIIGSGTVEHIGAIMIPLANGAISREDITRFRTVAGLTWI